MEDAQPKVGEEIADRERSYQERVALEHDNLRGMVDRLHNFVNGAAFESVSAEEQQLLKLQLGQMQGYLRALEARMKLHQGV